MTQDEIDGLVARLREHGKDAPFFSYRAMEDATIALTALRAERDAAVARAEKAEGRERVQHIKRGTTYRIVGQGKLQTDTPLHDYADLVAYRCEEDGDLWFRSPSEFTPDRFAALPADANGGE